jgi:protein gp37
MADKSLIEWTDATWTIVQGCDPVSPGCAHCYVPKVLWRLMHNPIARISDPLKDLVKKRGGDFFFTGKLALREDRLDWPLHWKAARHIFVPSHGDIFHKDVPNEFLDKIFARMALCPQHTFQVLTKRSDRMRSYITRGGSSWRILDRMCEVTGNSAAHMHWPLPNVWLGVSVERQLEADERRPDLEAVAAFGSTTFVSYEPALGPVDWRGWDFVKQIISGGENGPRPSHPDWHRATRDYCVPRGIAYFFKQWGSWKDCTAGGAIVAEDRIILPSGEIIGGGHPNHGGMVSDDWEERGAVWMTRVGKKLAGRELDGREWSEMPKSRAAIDAPPLGVIGPEGTPRAPCGVAW